MFFLSEIKHMTETDFLLENFYLKETYLKLILFTKPINSYNNIIKMTLFNLTTAFKTLIKPLPNNNILLLAIPLTEIISKISLKDSQHNLEKKGFYIISVHKLTKWNLLNMNQTFLTSSQNSPAAPMNVILIWSTKKKSDQIQI
jgi:hypothetical protein